MTDSIPTRTRAGKSCVSIEGNRAKKQTGAITILYKAFIIREHRRFMPGMIADTILARMPTIIKGEASGVTAHEAGIPAGVMVPKEKDEMLAVAIHAPIPAQSGSRTQAGAYGTVNSER